MNQIENPIQVIIIEDVDDYRSALVESFNEIDDLNCAGSFASFEDLEHGYKDSLGEVTPDVALLDIQLPGISGIEAIEKLKQLFPSIDVIMLTTFSDKRRVFDAICSGAMGYLLKTDGIDEIAKAIRVVHSGGSSLNDQVAHLVLNMFTNLKPKQVDHNLDDVELQVLRLLADGLQKKEIAAQLDVEDHHVNYYVRKIYKKLHVNSLSGAVAQAIRKGFI